MTFGSPLFTPSARWWLDFQGIWLQLAWVHGDHDPGDEDRS